MFDRFEPLEPLEGEFNHLPQQIEKSSFEVLSNLAPVIGKFETITFYHSPGSLDPKEMIQSLKRFLKEHK